MASTSVSPQLFIGCAAEAIEKRINYEYCGDAPDRDVSDPAQLEKIYYDPQRYLQGHLQRALAKTQRTGGARFASRWGEIIVWLEADEILVKLSDKQLRPLCVVPLDEMDVSIRLLSRSEVEAQRSQAHSSWQPLQPLLWKIALWTSRGRIPVGVPLDHPIYLKYWPNITRLLLTPCALRIAAFWTAQPSSLLETVAVLQIPQRYVFAFLSTVHSLGLVEFKQFPIKGTSPFLPLHPQQSALNRILERLRWASRSR